MFLLLSGIQSVSAQGKLHLLKFDDVTQLRDFFKYTGNGSIIVSGHRGGYEEGYSENCIEGLENVLKTARSITEGKLWVVFGCGGDRDNKKRPIMGRIALELADRVVVTSDNPRTEDPAVIIDEIAEALKDVPEGKSVELIAERRDAIYHALSEAAANDVIMIAGKGHENYQILADKTIHFDDREVVQEYWKKR